MARTWNEIQADMNAAREVREAASAAEARLEAEGAAKAAPWAFGLAALLGAGAWAAAARTPVTPAPTPKPAPKPVVRESWADARRREDAKDDARRSRDTAAATEGRAMDAWTHAVAHFDGRDDSALNLAKAKFNAATAAASVARARYDALA